MAGFIQDPIQFVNLIADNLRDRYQTGFPVLKELIQNTDDSQAPDLQFGLSTGLPRADHALLHGPALFLVNNGGFTSSDARGIRSFGQNSKAADQASIGKFGLGMKSVFHFCEAFFFLAHDGQRVYEEVLNPWSGAEPDQSLHAEWDAFSGADARAIREHLSAVTSALASDPDRAFILWLPLRRKAHLLLTDGSRAGAIVSEYPGDDETLLAFLDAEDLPIRIAALTPMLRHLDRAAYWRLGANGRTQGPRFEVRVGAKASRVSLVNQTGDASQIPETPRNLLNGRVSVVSGQSSRSLDFSGLEAYGWNRALLEMHADELWPSSYVRDRQGRSEEAKDKAQPHGSVFFSRIPGKGRLITNWSVFLPLDETKSVQIVPCEGDQDFRLTLHGYFFIDAGRQAVHGLRECIGGSGMEFDSEEALRRAWNCALLHSNVLPLVLPALDAFCTEQRLSDKSRSALSDALKRTSLVKDFLTVITAAYSWIREMTPDDVQWVLRAAEKKVLFLPAPLADDTDRPWRLFPALSKVSEQFWLAVDGAPSIVGSAVSAQWSAEQLGELLGSVAPRDLFKDSKLLHYLTSFLAKTAGPFRATQDVRRVLAGLIRQGLIANGEAALGQNQQLVRDLVIQLDPATCFKISNDVPRDLLRGLLSAETDALLLPARFFSFESRTDAVLSVVDAARFLAKVEQALGTASDASPELQDVALRLSEQLIKGVAVQQRAELLQRCAVLRVLGGFDCKAVKRIPVSVQEIRYAAEAGTLFGSSEGTTERKRLGLASELQQVLPRERILVINKDTANLALNVDGALPQCDGHAVLRCLGLKPRTLGGAAHRAALASFAGIPDGDAETRGLRFLLHSDQQHFQDDATLWTLGRQQEPVWRKLWAQLVGGVDEPWNLVDGSVANNLPLTVLDAVDVHDINAQSVLKEIEAVGVSRLDSSAFEQDECEQILQVVSDSGLWCSLPFHWTRRGHPVSGDSKNAYLDLGDVLLPEDLLCDVHRILPCQDGSLALRQTRLLKPLDEHAIIEIALNHKEVSGLWELMLDTLQRLDVKGLAPTQELSRGISESCWLPLATGALCKPEDVIFLEAASEEIDRILAQEPGAFVIPLNLASKVQAHPFFPRLRERYFARDAKALDQLGLVLSGLDAYHIGDSIFSDADALAGTARILEDYSHPGWQLLGALIAKIGADCCFDGLLPHMIGPMALASQVKLLNWLADRGSSDSPVVRVFDRYLSAFARTPNATSVVCELTLLNKEGQWRPSEKLASRVTGVSPDQVLHDDQARILSELIYQDNAKSDSAGAGDPVAFASETSSAGQILRDYFDPWTGRVASSLVGVLVLLHGCDESVMRLCEELLGQHSRPWLITQVPWDAPFSGTTDLRQSWLQGFTLEKALNYFRMSVRVNDGDTLKVRSIIGKTISVRLDERFDTLYVGRPGYYRARNRDGYRVELVLRRITTDEWSDSQLSDYLLTSATYLLREVYNQRQPEVGALWQELGQSDQVDIELAKALMLENIPFYLKQLGTHKHPALSERLERFRDNERWEKEFAGKPQQQRYRRDKEAALTELQRTIEQDAPAQRAILESVQRKIRDFQYQPESIPFELFQNADDALRDLEFITAYPAKPGGLEVDPLPAGVCRFVIEADSNQITFMHWGRAINQFGSKGFPGRQRGFDRDLENMLILSASDKGEDATGKFGLGFKSVWLVSDQPTVVSGRLQATIVGGLLPVPKYDKLTRSLSARLSDHQQDRRWPGTAIHLPLTRGISEGNVLDRFSVVAGAMVAFSRTVRAVEVRRADGSGFSASWDGQQLPGCPDIQLGRIRQGKGDPLLVARVTLADGSLLLAIGPRGFMELPREIPHLWVTAPIREDERLGFAINAMFEVDAGRSRLSADVSRNKALAQRLGGQLARELTRFNRSVMSCWETVAAAMQLAPGSEPYHLWESLWRTLLARLPQMERESGSRVVAAALLTEGLSHLTETHEVVPNGLPEGLHRLIRWTGAKTVLKGALGDAGVLQAVVRAPCFRSSLDPSSAVSSELATWLKLLIQDLGSRTDLLVSVGLTQLIGQLDRGRELRPEDADILGAALHGETLAVWEKAGEEVSQEVIKDFKAAVEKAGELSFLSAAGPARRCKVLLTDQGSDEEQRRWAFAPEDNRLADAYGEKGRGFFLLCRGKLEAPTEKLKTWVIQADDIDKRCAALRYLLDGELSRPVVSALQDTGFAGTWLAEIDEDSEYLLDWDPASRARLVYQILKTPEESRDAFQYRDIDMPAPPPPMDPRVALKEIHLWWEGARQESLKRYCQRTYPEGRPPQLNDDDVGNIDRSSWLLTLLLGGFHTMGNVQPEQHLSFIESCQRRGWWDVFTDPNPTQRFEEWMGVLDEYIDQQVDQQTFEQWMMRFPIIYKLSRHLDEYAELLLGLDRYRRSFDLQSVLTSAADPDQQGGGISAAALPSTLGIGANFVVRELLRLGVVRDSPLLHEHAFVPYRGVRGLLRELGWPVAEGSEPRLRLAPLIYGFLKQHMVADQVTFCGDFDIPLRIVAENSDLQIELLGRQLVFDYT